MIKLDVTRKEVSRMEVFTNTDRHKIKEALESSFVIYKERKELVCVMGSVLPDVKYKEALHLAKIKFVFVASNEKEKQSPRFQLLAITLHQSVDNDILKDILTSERYFLDKKKA